MKLRYIYIEFLDGFSIREISEDCTPREIKYLYKSNGWLLHQVIDLIDLLLTIYEELDIEGREADAISNLMDED